MTEAEFYEAAGQCTHFVGGHARRSVRERLQDLVDSEYSEFNRDMYGNGGFVAVFEAEIAELLGKEAAVIMPSGTMAQQIALRIWADRASNKSVAFHPLCHLEIHEHMAYRELHHLEAELLGEPDRLFTLADLKVLKRPVSSLLIEFPQREIGGQLPTWEEFEQISAYSKGEGIRLHLDGARLWESQPYFDRTYAEICEPFDSVYVSFYKILFGLPGAALAGPKDFIAEARIWLRRHGGNLSNMFPTAIAAKVGMDRFLPKVPAYVAKAQEIAAGLNKIPGVKVIPEIPPTNMMHLVFDVELEALRTAVGKIAQREKCLLLGSFSQKDEGVRCEMNVGDAGLEIPTERITSLFSEAVAKASSSIDVSSQQ